MEEEEEDVDFVEVLGELGSLVECPICHDLLDAPVFFPSCSHVFCSRCLAAALRFVSACPVCREPRESSVAVAVPLLDRVATVLRRHQNKIEHMLDKKTREKEEQEEMEEMRKKKKASTKTKNKTKTKTTTTTTTTTTTPSSSQRMEMSSGSKKRERVEEAEEMSQHRSSGSAGPYSQRAVCLDCGLQVRDLEAHALECLGKGEEERARFAQANKGSEQRDKRKKMGKTHYKGLKLSSLKKLCKQTGISDEGDKVRLEWRHTNFRELYNANLDRAVPKPDQYVRAELVKLEKEKFAPQKRGKALPDWKRLVDKAKKKMDEVRKVDLVVVDEDHDDDDDFLDDDDDDQAPLEKGKEEMYEAEEQVVEGRGMEEEKVEEENVKEDLEEKGIEEEEKEPMELEEENVDLNGVEEMDVEQDLVVLVEEEEISVSQQQKFSTSRWSQVWSHVAGRMFYFDRDLQQGSFTPPQA